MPTEPKGGNEPKPGRISKLKDLIQKVWFAGEGWDWDSTGGPNQAHDFGSALLNDDYSDQLLGTLTAALADTIDSILDDPMVSDKHGQIDTALQDYAAKLEAVGIAKAGRKMSGQRLDNLKDIHQKLGDMITDLDNPSGGGDGTGEGDDDVMTIDKSKLSDDVRKYLESIEQRATEAEAKAAELAKAAGGNANPEDIWKGVPAEVRKRVEEAESRAKGAEEVAKREEDKRITREFVAKAQSFRGLAVQAEEFSGVLKSLAGAAPEAYEKLESVLQAADVAIVKSGIFKEIGGSGVKAGSAADQIEQLAKSKVEASGGKMTIQKARAEVRKENRDLAAREREEKGFVGNSGVTRESL